MATTNTKQLTFIRFLAATAIVIFHFGSDGSLLTDGILKSIYTNGDVGVSFFFTLSGFVLIIAYYNTGKPFNIREFYKNRIARILPLYYFSFIIMTLYFIIRLSILKLPFPYSPTLTDVFLNLTLTQAWIPFKALTYNSAAWSLSNELVFYLIFPFILKSLIEKFSFAKLTIIVFTFFIVSQILFHFIINSSNCAQTIEYWTFAPWLHINAFLIGIWFGVYFVTNRSEPKNNFVSILSTLLILLIILIIKPYGLNFHNGLLSVFFGILIYLLAKDSGLISRILRLRLFEFLGEISYGIYLLQFPTYFFFTGTLKYFGYQMEPSYFYYYLLILFSFSALAYQYLEKPARRWIKNEHISSIKIFRAFN